MFTFFPESKSNALGDLYKNIEKEVRKKLVKSKTAKMFQDDKNFTKIAKNVVANMNLKFPEDESIEHRFYNDLANYMNDKDNNKPFMRIISPATQKR